MARRAQLGITLHPRHGATRWPVRAATEADAEALAALMLDAYRGTIDYDGEDLDAARAEIGRLLRGDYGAPRLQHSWVIEAGAQLASAALVTIFNELPLLAFLMTRAESKAQGMGQELVLQVLHDLQRAGFAELRLFVTIGNDPALAIYRKLGFVEIPSAPDAAERA